ncbi:MAG: adenylyltransferase/cytidyltransferase family protein [Candidatus Woesearchaeota archaeon]|jgi:cytidyltransferase-like protein
MIKDVEYYFSGQKISLPGYLWKLGDKGIKEEEIIAAFPGRFMPYHFGHYETHKRIAASYDRMHIGIVNPDPWDTKLTGERFTLDKNFLTYAERIEMIGTACDEIRRKLPESAKFTMGPYYPKRWYGEEVYSRFNPGNKDTFLQHLAVRDDFDRDKVQRLIKSQRNFAIVPLVRDGERIYSATLIRKLMLEGEEWRELVPSFTESVIDKHHIVERLRDLNRDISG